MLGVFINKSMYIQDLLNNLHFAIIFSHLISSSMKDVIIAIFCEWKEIVITSMIAPVQILMGMFIYIYI